MPYFPILQKPTQNNLITKTSFRQDAPSPWRKNRRRAVSYVSTGLLAYPVTPRTHIYRRRAVVEASREANFVAERRHLHVTRYAERSGSVPGLSASPSQLRAGGTPLPHKQRTLPCEKPPKSGCRGIQRGTFRRGAFWAAN